MPTRPPAAGANDGALGVNEPRARLVLRLSSWLLVAVVFIGVYLATLATVGAWLGGWTFATRWKAAPILCGYAVIGAGVHHFALAWIEHLVDRYFQPSSDPKSPTAVHEESLR